MKLFVTGTRGFPGIMGGVETHCEQLYTRLARLGVNITVARRRPYLTDSNRGAAPAGIRFADLYAPRDKHFEAIVHTFLAIIRARRSKADVLHIHGIGPGLLAPMARLLGLKVVLTVHSFNYDHDKWNAVAKSILRLGEWCSIRWANAVIAISDPIRRSLSERYPKKKINLIYNGVNKVEPTDDRSYLSRIGVGERPYILALGRFTPEKGFHDLVEAYAASGLRGTCDLVIAGAPDHETDYSRRLVEDARREGVILPGFVSGDPLRQLFSGASLSVLPSYNEGLPIAMLEAMSYGIDIIASDIEPNRLPMLEDGDFYPVGDTGALAEALRRKAAEMPKRRHYGLTPFDWDRIADATLELYKSL